MQKTILIVDDEADIRNLVKEILEDEGYSTITAANSKQVYEILEQEKPDMAILDIWLQDSRHDGLQILETIKAGEHSDIPVIMISGHGTIETAVSSIKQGAYDFIEKPFKSDRLLLMVQRGLEAASLRQENAALKARSSSGADIIGHSPQAKNLRERVKVLAGNKSRLFIEGPLGSGKTTVARLIHLSSDFAQQPFIIFACGSEQSEKSAIEKVLEQAAEGTVVFQNIDGLNVNDQKHLLALLNEEKHKARVIATSKKSDTLDQNLHRRIGIETLVVPSLEERRQDISDILDYFIRQTAYELGVSIPSPSKEVVRLCEDYNWQGNLYELRAAMIWAVVHNDGNEEIQSSSLPSSISGFSIDDANVEMLPVVSNGLDRALLDLSLREAREVFEREYLTSQVDRFEGNISKTAQFIGMERSALHRKIKSLQDKENDTHATNKQVASVKT